MHRGLVAAVGDRIRLAIAARLDIAVHRIEDIVAVGLGSER